MRRYLEFTKEEIWRLYIDERLTQRQIAERYGCNERTIRRAMRNLGIPARFQKKEKVERNCPQCGKITRNPKFCSTSCAAIFNNKHFPKRTAERIRKQRYCVTCGRPTKNRRKYCQECKPTLTKWLSKSIGDLQRDGYYQMYRIVRMVARKIYKDSELPLSCSVCGYSTHVEISHKRAISSFDKRTLIAEVNHLDNLVALCPNHHWEFDRGLIKV